SLAMASPSTLPIAIRSACRQLSSLNAGGSSRPSGWASVDIVEQADQADLQVSQPVPKAPATRMELHRRACPGHEQARWRVEQAQVDADALGITDPAITLLRLRQPAIGVDLAVRHARVQRGDLGFEQLARQRIERHFRPSAAT